MAKEPTPQEVKAEIAKLKEMKPRVRHYSGFGDDNHAAIDAQIEVLSGEVDEDEIDEKCDDGEWSDHEYSSAREALDWMNGDSDDGAPSEGWESIAD